MSSQDSRVGLFDSANFLLANTFFSMQTLKMIDLAPGIRRSLHATVAVSV